MQAPVLLSQRHVHARIRVPTQAKVILVRPMPCMSYRHHAFAACEQTVAV